jgi:N utilization substance protein B
LRLGAYEVLFCPEVPAKVAINEALELAKRYSTSQSSRFVNGILDRVLQLHAAPPADMESVSEGQSQVEGDATAIPAAEHPPQTEDGSESEAQ